jgi:hypothetical protein
MSLLPDMLSVMGPTRIYCPRNLRIPCLILILVFELGIAIPAGGLPKACFPVYTTRSSPR